MTLLRALPILLVALFGSPEAIFRAHVAAAIERLCPCSSTATSSRTTCVSDHARIVDAIVDVAESEDDAVRLLAACAHESRCRDVRQVGGGPARGPWQVEMRPASDELVMQARWALRAARAGWHVYACGSGDCPAKAAELGRYEARARWAWGR